MWEFEVGHRFYDFVNDDPVCMDQLNPGGSLDFVLDQVTPPGSSLWMLLHI